MPARSTFALAQAPAFAFAFAFAIAILHVSSRAWAEDDPSLIEVRLALEGKVVTASFDVTGAFTETFRRRLGGGLTSQVVIQMHLVAPDGDRIASAERTCHLRLDVWDDLLFVRIQDESEAQDHSQARRREYSLVDDALKACGVIVRSVIADIDRLPQATRYRLAITVLLNPVSEELLDRTREFTSNLRGTRTGRPRAFFGAVAKLFSKESAATGEIFLFESQMLARPAKEAGD